MSDAHGAAYNRSPEVNGLCGNLPWQVTDDYGGYGSGPSTESHNDGDNDTDDIGTYSPIPRPVENQGVGDGFNTPGQRGFNRGGGGWN